MINYSVILFAQDTLGSAWLSGLGLGLCFGPPLILGWFAGVLCDRLAPGRVIQGAQAVFFLSALVFWWTLLREPVDRAVTLLLSAGLAGVAWSFASPARMAALAQITPADRLKKTSVLFNVFVMLGFGLGPLTIAVLRQWGAWPWVVRGILMLSCWRRYCSCRCVRSAAGRCGNRWPPTCGRDCAPYYINRCCYS